jgi:hypothetical protein
MSHDEFLSAMLLLGFGCRHLVSSDQYYWPQAATIADGTYHSTAIRVYVYPDKSLETCFGFNSPEKRVALDDYSNIYKGVIERQATVEAMTSYLRKRQQP